MTSIKTASPLFQAGTQGQCAILVVPCYNEQNRLQTRKFLDFVDGTPRVRLLFVNDGSTDATISILQSLAAARPERISVLDLPRNGGKAEAVRAGLLRAIQEGAQLVGYWDADLATPLDLVEDFLRVADRDPRVEVIFGTRRQMLGHRVNRDFHRRVVSRICGTLARFAIGLPVADTQCGAKMLRVTPAVTTALMTPFTTDWLFDVELFSRIARGGQGPAEQRFFELPLAAWTEMAGSKVSAYAILKSGVKMLELIARLRFNGAAASNCVPDAEVSESWL